MYSAVPQKPATNPRDVAKSSNQKEDERKRKSGSVSPEKRQGGRGAFEPRQRTPSWPDESDKKNASHGQKNQTWRLLETKKSRKHQTLAICQKQSVNQNQTGPPLRKRKGNQHCPNPMCKVLIRRKKNPFFTLSAWCRKSEKEGILSRRSTSRLCFELYHFFLPRKPMRAYGLSSLHIETLRNSGSKNNRGEKAASWKPWNGLTTCMSGSETSQNQQRQGWSSPSPT